MDVKEAVKTARIYLADLYSDEEIVNVGLEEVRYDYDADKWHITLGFSRPWDRKHPSTGAMSEAGRPDRSYKEICINDADGRVESLMGRVLGAPPTV